MNPAWAVLLAGVMLGPTCGMGPLVVHGGSPPDAGDVPSPSPSEPSNGLDDNGNGVFDEGTSVARYPCADPARCTCADTHTRCGDECFARDGAPAQCGGACMLLRDDAANCGVCGNACPAGNACVGGACRCGEGRRFRCGEACVDLEYDLQNCGACGRVCFGGAICLGGRCQCASGFVPGEGGECHANGGAGLYCPGGCPPGSTCYGNRCDCGARCGGSCRDYTSDPSHCGGCGNACPAGVPCVGGRCGCDAPRTACGRECVDARSDRTNCGACGRVCDATQQCDQGMCRLRQGSPAAGERVSAGRVALRWPAARGVADVCADRGCARVLETVAAAPGATAWTRPLATGVYFWRIRADGVGPTTPVPFRVDHRAAPRPGLLPPAPDLNGDGLGDVVVTGERGVQVFFGAPAPAPLAAGPRVMLTTVGSDAAPLLGDDVSGDGFGEVFAVTHWATERVWLSGPGALAHEAATGWGRRTRPLLDVNDDALPDAVSVTSYVRVSYGLTLGGGAPWVLLDGFDGWPSAVAPVGDVNGDGYRDVAFASSAAAEARTGVDPGGASPRADVYLGSSVGLDRAFRAPPPAPGGAFLMGVGTAGDVNGDGFADVLVDVGGVQVVVYFGGASALTLHRTLAAPMGTSIVAGAAGDVDGDGRGDLVVVPRRSGELWWYRGGAAGLAATPEVLRDPRWAGVDAVGLPRDVDGDGFDDVVLGSPARGSVYVLHGAPTRALTRVEELPMLAPPGSVLRVL